MFARVIRSEVGRIGDQIGGVQTVMDARFDGLQAATDARFDSVDARFAALTTRLDGLDRDIQFLIKDRFDKS